MSVEVFWHFSTCWGYVHSFASRTVALILCEHTVWWCRLKNTNFHPLLPSRNLTALTCLTPGSFIKFLFADLCPDLSPLCLCFPLLRCSCCGSRGNVTLWGTCGWWVVPGLWLAAPSGVGMCHHPRLLLGCAWWQSLSLYVSNIVLLHVISELAASRHLSAVRFVDKRCRWCY